MSVPMKPVEELDDWLVRAEVRAFAEQQKDVENRAKCPGCDEIGIWLVQSCTDGSGAPVADGVYCGVHAPPSIHAGEGVLSMNGYGWVFRNGAWFTWDEGFPRFPELARGPLDGPAEEKTP